MDQGNRGILKKKRHPESGDTFLRPLAVCPSNPLCPLTGPQFRIFANGDGEWSRHGGFYRLPCFTGETISYTFGARFA
jgi:hypothetical protein